MGQKSPARESSRLGRAAVTVYSGTRYHGQSTILYLNLAVFRPVRDSLDGKDPVVRYRNLLDQSSFRIVPMPRFFVKSPLLLSP